MTTAWLVLALGDRREHAGNDGYDDNPAEHYSWDSTVPNHARLAEGDVIALWDRKELIGVSVIEAIETDTREKTLYFCPHCDKAAIKRRQQKAPQYRCYDCGTSFDVPGRTTKQVTTYRSRHGEAWMEARGLLSGAELRALCDSPRSQHSMRPARWEKLRNALAAVTGNVGELDALEETRLAIPGGHRETVVRVRIGQGAFRKRLLADQGELCAFTGPAPATALEAAHLYSYAQSGEHHEHGGLLLRRDIHRLFDLGEIAVNPTTGTLDISAEMLAYPLYASLQGKPVSVPLQREHRTWLGRHWRLHRPES
ncbi:hypothetical protein LRR80_04605 [Streptomyces sp. RO-S4]|uniref:HNH endonuclease n=1 Tax=Streptomyces sp. RO-S4 TaxID=2902486 RepID=UPI00208EA41E|nr:HNH endonuclease [Streptomyces sp. RO-S4]MCO4698525.1 hypothetical protein [Streptomyces sp. RO-S4]